MNYSQEVVAAEPGLIVTFTPFAIVEALPPSLNWFWLFENVKTPEEELCDTL